MKKKKLIDLEIKKHFDRALINSLLCSPSLEMDLEMVKSSMLNESFLESFDIILNVCLKSRKYSQDAYNNMEKILKFMKVLYQKNKDGIDYNSYIDNYYKLLGKYNEAKVNIGYEIYQDEFNSKINSIEEINLKESYLWNKKDMDESIRFDYDVLFSSKIDEESYMNWFFCGYIFNQKYIYFIRKMFVNDPVVFLDETIKRRAIGILSHNEALCLETDKKVLVEKFALYNYGANINGTDEFEKYQKMLDIFMKNCKYLKIKLLNLNKNNYLSNFRIQIFVDYYQKSLLEKSIVANELEIINPENTMQLEYLYKLINDNVRTKICGEGMKTSIIDMLHIFKENYKLKDRSEFIKRYNKYLGMLNVTESNTYGMVDYLIYSKLSYLESIKMSIRFGMTDDFSEYDELVDTIKTDYQILNSFIWDDKKYRDEEIHFISSSDYAQSINKCFNEYPEMFDNDVIYSRVTGTLNKILQEYQVDKITHGSFYRENAKILKKIDKYFSKEDKK